MILCLIKHENVLPFVGIVGVMEERSAVWLISGWMENGDITQYIERHPEAPKEYLVRLIDMEGIVTHA